MTDQTPESPDPRPTDETTPSDVAEVVVDAEVVEPEMVEPEVVELDLGSEQAPVPTGTDFDVVTEPRLSDAERGDIDLGAQPAPPAAPEPLPSDPAAPTPAAPVASESFAPPAGGSFLDLPPLPDLSYPAPTPPPASPYPPPAPSYPRAANYPQPAAHPQADYAPYPADYGQQVAGQAYGHGATTPQPHPAPAIPANPYGAPTGFAVQPYQPVMPVGDVTMASAAHWGALIATVASGSALGFLVPLIIMLTKGQSDPFVRANAAESLNFNLTVLLGMIVSAVLVLVFVGIVGLIVIPIVALILQILGAIAANRGEVYRYPVSIRFVK